MFIYKYFINTDKHLVNPDNTIVFIYKQLLDLQV